MTIFVVFCQSCMYLCDFDVIDSVGSQGAGGEHQGGGVARIGTNVNID